MKGAEVNVAVLDGKALGAIEIVPANEFYDYAAKYTRGDDEVLLPRAAPGGARAARADGGGARAPGRSAAAASRRVDFIVAPDGTPFILEVNTLPGMTATSLVPKIAAGLGISFPRSLRADPRRRGAEGVGARGATRPGAAAGTSNRPTQPSRSSSGGASVDTPAVQGRAELPARATGIIAARPSTLGRSAKRQPA